MPFCTCPDWIKWHLPCKYFFAVFSLYPSWDWYKLPQAYLESAYLSTDQQSLDNFFNPNVDNNDKECKLDSFDKVDNSASDEHDMDVPTSTTDVSGLDCEENYLNPIPKHEVCIVAFVCLLSFCLLTKSTALLKKFGVSARTNLKVLENTYIQFY